MKKTILLLLCLFLLTGCFSCGNDNSAPPDDTTAKSTEATPKTAQIIIDGQAQYQVVYPEKADKDVKDLVDLFTKKIKEKSGVNLKFKTDSIRDGEVHDKNAMEILVGITNYDESQKVLGSISINDYAIKIEGNKIVITAHTTAMLQRAVNYFVSTLNDNISTDGNGKVVSLSCTDYVYNGNYPIASITVDGKELRDFRIVYDEKSSAAKNAADSLKNSIAVAYKAILPVVSDASPKTANEILIGKTNRPESQKYYSENKIPLVDYKISVSNGNLLFCADGNYSINKAVTAFSEKYLLFATDKVTIDGNMTLASEEGSVDFRPLTEGANLRIMTANILAKRWGGTPETMRSEIVQSVLKSYQPDVVGLQEIADEWTSVLKSAFDGKYAYIYDHNIDGVQNYTTMIYRQDKFNVIESGVYYYNTHKKNNIRLVTWAIFENKADASRFAVFNTHWSFDSMQVQIKHAEEMSALISRVTSKYDVPVFCTGDFNAKPDTDSYKKFSELSGLQDVRLTAAVTVSPEIDGTHNLGVKDWIGTGNIDHIFASSNIKALKFETIVGYAVVDLSDHCPRYADFILPKQ